MPHGKMGDCFPQQSADFNFFLFSSMSYRIPCQKIAIQAMACGAIGPWAYSGHGYTVEIHAL